MLVAVLSRVETLGLSAQAVKGKQNELSTLPSVLDTLAYLDVAGCIVTIDAMGTQRTVARKLVALQAQYVLALKGNQDTLFEDVQEMFDDASRRLFADTALLGVSTWDDPSAG
ncbi:ISAs1 family transposase [Deinococcus indicus]|uniref:ISAs1 family transposase n=1 Tax=Deinococcus indicus TaxID=223556 RepID=UPI001C0EFB9C|nr:ISAs1 family transposase [Deinococcus indicus]